VKLKGGVLSSLGERLVLKITEKRWGGGWGSCEHSENLVGDKGVIKRSRTTRGAPERSTDFSMVRGAVAPCRTVENSSDSVQRRKGESSSRLWKIGKVILQKRSFGKTETGWGRPMTPV